MFKRYFLIALLFLIGWYFLSGFIRSVEYELQFYFAWMVP